MLLEAGGQFEPAAVRKIRPDEDDVGSRSLSQRKGSLGGVGDPAFIAMTAELLGEHLRVTGVAACDENIGQMNHHAVASPFRYCERSAA